METAIYNFLDKIEAKMRDREFTQKLDFFFDIIKLLSFLFLVFLFATQTKLMLAITAVFIFLLFVGYISIFAILAVYFLFYSLFKKIRG